MKYSKLIILAIILAFSAEIASAGGSGSAAVDFLNIGVSAKSTAMGGAFSAIADGPASSFYNPAGLSSINNYQIAGMHTEWLQDLRYEYLGLGLPAGSSGGFGLSFSYLSYGTIQGFSELNASTGNIEAYDMALTLSYGHKITQDLSIGLGLKNVGERLDNVKANGFAGDFGLQYRVSKYHAGLSIMNFGPELRYESASSPLPTTINAGLAYYPLNSSLALITGATFPFHGEFSFKTGVEYSYQNMFMLRSGYDSGNNLDGKSGISFGGGIAMSGHNLDYAYNINDLMGGTHQISFALKFGQPRTRNEYRSSAPKVIKSKPEVEELYTVLPSKQEANEVKRIFQVCAARYQNKDSARRHIDTLKKFDISSKLYQDVSGEYRIVIKETDNLSKAEKIKEKYDNKGVFCFVHEL